MNIEHFRSVLEYQEVSCCQVTAIIPVGPRGDLVPVGSKHFCFEAERNAHSAGGLKELNEGKEMY